MKKICYLSVMLVLCLIPATIRADDLDLGKQLLAQGKIMEAAGAFNRYASSHPDEKRKTPEALVMCGRILDAIADSLTEAAEKKCYWVKGAPRTPACMEAEAAKLNVQFGEGAFRYEHAVTYIPYTGMHYRIILERFPKSEYEPEADFYLLLRELVGHPDRVLPKIKAFLKRHPKGEWHRRGLLLSARVNEDIWYIHRKWSWVLYNYEVSPDELIIRAEPYRQEALRAYEELLRDEKTFEGKIAAREYSLLKANAEDSTTYSIVNDSSGGTLDKWGIWSAGGAASGPIEGEPPITTPSEKKKVETPKIPKRWE